MFRCLFLLYLFICSCILFFSFSLVFLLQSCAAVFRAGRSGRDAYIQSATKASAAGNYSCLSSVFASSLTHSSCWAFGAVESITDRFCIFSKVCADRRV